jgi:hypothetical protein
MRHVLELLDGGVSRVFSVADSARTLAGAAVPPADPAALLAVAGEIR